MLNVVLDTNALFKPLLLRQLANKPNIKLWGSVLNIIETVSDINNDISFRRARAQLRLIAETGRNILPDPDAFLRMQLGRTLPDGYILVWESIIDVVIDAHDYDEFVEGIVDTTESARRRVDTEAIRQWRDHYDAEFVSDSMNMIHSLNPNANMTTDGWGVRLPEGEIAALHRHFEFPEIDSVVVETMIRRSGLDPRTLSIDEMKQARQSLDVFLGALKGHMLYILEYGAKPEANDYNDIHFAVYLAEPDWVLITDEKSIFKKLTYGGVQQSRFCKPESLL